jgi:hypothetical protein
VPLRFVLFLTMVSLAATPALGEMHSNENPAMSDRCRTLPDGGAPDANGNSTDEEAMSETLEDCQGVLKPPRTGDSELIEPAPDIGKTPFIRPHEIPED